MNRADMNPLEALVDELADRYVYLVEDVAATIAPFRPWWTAELTADQQVYRWQKMREPIVTWLADISPYMGWDSLETAVSTTELRRLFTDRNIGALVPIDLLTDERADGLKQLVQSAGPFEASRHIARVEAMVRRRIQAAAMLQPVDPIGTPGAVPIEAMRMDRPIGP